jgi:hypothetical protein
MKEWAPTMFEDYQAVDMGNCYFTNRKHVSLSELVRFKAVSEGTDVAHIRENEVEYFKPYEYTGGQNRYTCILTTLYDD